MLSTVDPNLLPASGFEGPSWWRLEDNGFVEAPPASVALVVASVLLLILSLAVMLAARQELVAFKQPLKKAFRVVFERSLRH